MAVALKQKLILNHNALIEQLEETYNDYIARILEQKRAIITKMHNELYQEF